jgi:ABC-type Fe3+/spermidine/putrescine transport system ATPase subunit
VAALEGQEAMVSVPGLGGEVMGLAQGDLRVGQAVTISVRPEKIQVTDSSGFSVNHFSGRIVNTAYFGSDTRLILDCGDGVRLSVWEQNRISIVDQSILNVTGRNVTVTWLSENALVLPA